MENVESGGVDDRKEISEYVDCKCIVCDWTDGFKPSAMTKGLVGGWCDKCNRESVFKEVEKPIPPQTDSPCS